VGVVRTIWNPAQQVHKHFDSVDLAVLSGDCGVQPQRPRWNWSSTQLDDLVHQLLFLSFPLLASRLSIASCLQQHNRRVPSGRRGIHPNLQAPPADERGLAWVDWTAMLMFVGSIWVHCVSGLDSIWRERPCVQCSLGLFECNVRWFCLSAMFVGSIWVQCSLVLFDERGLAWVDWIGLDSIWLQCSLVACPHDGSICGGAAGARQATAAFLRRLTFSSGSPQSRPIFLCFVWLGMRRCVGKRAEPWPRVRMDACRWDEDLCPPR